MICDIGVFLRKKESRQSTASINLKKKRKRNKFANFVYTNYRGYAFEVYLK